MKTLTSSLKRIQSTVLLFSIALALLGSCAKEKPHLPEPEPVPVDTIVAVDSSLFYKRIRVENVAGGVQINDKAAAAASTAPPGDHYYGTFYFSLEQQKRFEEIYVKTNQWDMAFSGIKNVNISANNGEDSNNFGSGNRARGWVAVVEQSFEELSEVPEKLRKITNRTGVHMDGHGDFGDGLGWVLYDFMGLTVRNGDVEDSHVAYALGEGLSLADSSILRPRTLLLQTANGNIAKIKMISLYKDLFHAEEWFRKSPSPYFTFEYVLIPKGETQFIIKP